MYLFIFLHLSSFLQFVPSSSHSSTPFFHHLFLPLTFHPLIPSSFRTIPLFIHFSSHITFLLPSLLPFVYPFLCSSFPPLVYSFISPSIPSFFPSVRLSAAPRPAPSVHHPVGPSLPFSCCGEAVRRFMCKTYRLLRLFRAIMTTTLTNGCR